MVQSSLMNESELVGGASMKWSLHLCLNVSIASDNLLPNLNNYACAVKLVSLQLLVSPPPPPPPPPPPHHHHHHHTHTHAQITMATDQGVIALSYNLIVGIKFTVDKL